MMKTTLKLIGARWKSHYKKGKEPGLLSNKGESMGKCNKCGLCCKAIVIDSSMEQIKQSVNNQRKGNSDAHFIFRNWTSISEQAAFTINPNLTYWSSDYDGYRYYYRCRMYCDATNLCKIHEIRPYICSEFPWYGQVKKVPLYSLSCGYRADMFKGAPLNSEYKSYNKMFGY